MEESGGDKGFPRSRRNHGPSGPQLVVNLAPAWPMMRPCSPQCLPKNGPQSRHGPPGRAKTPQNTSKGRFSSMFDPSRPRFLCYVHASCYHHPEEKVVVLKLPMCAQWLNMFISIFNLCAPFSKQSRLKLQYKAVTWQSRENEKRGC